MKKQTLLGTLLGLSLLSSATVAHIEQSEPLQSLRQSYFARQRTKGKPGVALQDIE